MCLDFVTLDVSRMVFKGGILGSAYHFLGETYLNSTAVLFDTVCTYTSYTYLPFLFQAKLTVSAL